MNTAGGVALMPPRRAIGSGKRGVVYINGRFFAQRLTGTQRYARETLTWLDHLVCQVAPPFDIILIAPRDASVPPLRRIKVRTVGPLRGHAWEQVTLAWASRGGLLVSFGPTGPLVKRHQVVTIHDAAIRTAPQTFRRAFRAWYAFAIPILARRAPAVMTVSAFSRAEVMRHFGVPRERIWVSGAGAQHLLDAAVDQSVLEGQGLERGRYVLVVGSIARHKNLEAVADVAPTLATAGVRVLIVGTAYDRIFAEVNDAGLKSVTVLASVSDAGLRALYENALALVQPSLYEGFGIPLLEAMALGCPVVASTAAAIPEVCGEAAVYFEPSDRTALAGCIRRLLAAPEERARLSDLGRRRALEYSWGRCAHAFLGMLAATLA